MANKNTPIDSRHRRITRISQPLVAYLLILVGQMHKIRLRCIFISGQNCTICIFGHSSPKLTLIFLYFNLDKLQVDRQLPLTHSM